MRSEIPIPEPLDFLEPFIRQLEKLSPEELNEDVDDRLLFEIFSGRFESLSKKDTEAAVETIRDEVEAWAKNGPADNGPAHWILGALTSPGLAAHLIDPPSEGEEKRRLQVTPPEGWSQETVYGRVDLTKGDLFVSLGVSSWFGNFWHKLQWKLSKPVLDTEAARSAEKVVYGKIRGTKYTYIQTAPFPWKEIDYMLRVPGGTVCVHAGTEKGKDFDESRFEDCLATLSIVSS